MFPAERSSRRVSERHLGWRRQRSLPVSNWDTKSCFSVALLGSCSCLAWGVQRLAKDTTLLCLFSKPNQLVLGRLNNHLYQSAAPVYFPFSLWFYCLEPLCFLTTPPNSNYPPFSPYESDFVDTPHASPSQVNNFGCAVGLGSPFRWSNMWHFGWGFLFSIALAVQSKFILPRSACRLLQTLYSRHVGFNMSRTMSRH